MRAALLGAILAFAPLQSSGAPEQDWNRAIAWQPYAAGLQQAKRERKPVCLVIYTTWCPHCTAYARLFHTAGVAASARRFVMIKVDKDAEPALSKKYGLDGEYIPRTYFLTPDGEVARIDSGRSDYRYFYDEADPGSLLAAMQKALAR